METNQSPMMRRFVIFSATLVWATLGLQLYLTTTQRLANGNTLIDGLVFYFSFFTILANILVALALTLPLLRARSRFTEFFSRPTVNTAITASIVMVGITYNLLLRHLWNPQGMQLVADELLHVVMPLLFLLYWWLTVPKGLLRWADVLRWTPFPLLYAAYALLRGALSGVYPYPFIDAGQLGYSRVFVNTAGLLFAFIVIALLLIAAGRLRNPAPASSA